MSNKGTYPLWWSKKTVLAVNIYSIDPFRVHLPPTTVKESAANLDTARFTYRNIVKDSVSRQFSISIQIWSDSLTLCK
jgi:hypothetical protein